jgi:hypothetical protein
MKSNKYQYLQKPRYWQVDVKGVTLAFIENMCSIKYKHYSCFGLSPWRCFELGTVVQFIVCNHRAIRNCKVVPLHIVDGACGERRYSCYSFLISALEGGEWSASRPGRALPPGKEPPVPTVQEAGWAPEPVCSQTLSRPDMQSKLHTVRVLQKLIVALLVKKFTCVFETRKFITVFTVLILGPTNTA